MREGSLGAAWAGFVASMLGFLGLALALRPRFQQAPGLGVLTWMAIAWCVLSTITAALLHSIAREAAADVAKARLLHLISFALLETGALGAGLAHLASPLDYGIYAAGIPLAALFAFRPGAG